MLRQLDRTDVLAWLAGALLVLAALAWATWATWAPAHQSPVLPVPSISPSAWPTSPAPSAVPLQS